MGLIDPISSKSLFIFSGAIYSIIVRLANILVAFLLSVMVARLIGKESFGIFVFLASVSLFIAIINSFGLGRIALRLFAGEKCQTSSNYRSRLFEHFIVIWAIIGLIVFSLSLVLYFLLFDNLPFKIEWLLAVMSVCYGLLVGWRIIAVDIYVANRRPLDAAVFDGFLSNLILLVLLFFLYALNLRPVELLDVVTLYVFIVLMIQLISLLRMKSVLQYSKSEDLNRPDMPVSRLSLLKEARFAFYHRFGMSVSSLSDVWLLAIFGTTVFLADYGVALKVATFISFLLVALNGIIPPYFNQYIERGECQRLESFCRFFATAVAVPSLLLAAILFFYGGEIIILLFGASYEPAGGVLRILVVIHIANVLSGPCGNMLVQYGKNKELMKVTLIMAVLTVTAALVAGISGGGSLVIVWCFVIGSVLRQFALWQLAKKLCGVNTAPSLDMSILKSEFKRLI